MCLLVFVTFKIIFFCVYVFFAFVLACFLFHFLLFSVSLVLIVSYFKFFYCSFCLLLFCLFIICLGFDLSIYLLYSYFVYVCVCHWWYCLFCFCSLSWVLCFLFSSFPFLSFLSGHTVWLTGSWLPDQRSDLGLWGGSPESRTLDHQRIPRTRESAYAFLEVSFSTPRPGSTQLPAAPVLGISCQTTSKIGTQPHPSADRQPKVILSSQTPPKHTS